MVLRDSSTLYFCPIVRSNKPCNCLLRHSCFKSSINHKCNCFVIRVQWARLGDLDIDSTEDNARPKDYRIVKHVIHPNYKRSERYNDIALFQLETNAEFSQYVRPICLNTDPSLDPDQMIATGWGKTASGMFLRVLITTSFFQFVDGVCNWNLPQNYQCIN